MAEYFVILDQNNNLIINPSVRHKIVKCSYPIFLVCDGTTRFGKSTTLNQIIRGYNATPRGFTYDKPFKRGGDTNSITKGVDIWGPIKLSELLKKNGIDPPNSNVDPDVFLVDTEGFDSQNGSSDSFPAVFAIQQISTLCVTFSKGDPNVKTLNSLKRTAKFKECLKKIGGGPQTKSLLFVTNASLESNKEYSNDLSEEEYNKQYTLDLNKIRSSRAAELKQNLNKSIESDLIISGPYPSDPRARTQQENPNLIVYWDSLKDILIKFKEVSQTKFSGKQICDTIDLYLEIFKGAKITEDMTDINDIIEKIFKTKLEEEIKEIEKDFENYVNNKENHSESLNVYSKDKIKCKEHIEKIINEKYRQYQKGKISKLQYPYAAFSKQIYETIVQSYNSLIDQHSQTIKDNSTNLIKQYTTNLNGELEAIQTNTNNFLSQTNNGTDEGKIKEYIENSLKEKAKYEKHISDYQTIVEGKAKAIIDIIEKNNNSIINQFIDFIVKDENIHLYTQKYQEQKIEKPYYLFEDLESQLRDDKFNEVLEIFYKEHQEYSQIKNLQNDKSHQIAISTRIQNFKDAIFNQIIQDNKDIPKFEDLLHDVEKSINEELNNNRDKSLEYFFDLYKDEFAKYHLSDKRIEKLRNIIENTHKLWLENHPKPKPNPGFWESVAIGFGKFGAKVNAVVTAPIVGPAMLVTGNGDKYASAMNDILNL